MNIKSNITKLLTEETQLSVGCTEPVTIAYASAIASEYCRGEIKSIKILLSPGILKNAYIVGIPGTGEKGIALAAILGALSKNSSEKLSLLKNLPNDVLQLAKDLLKKNIITIDYDCNLTGIYVESTITTEYDFCKVLIKGSHTHVDLIEFNEKVIYQKQQNSLTKDNNFNLLDYELLQLIDEIEKIPPQELEFLLEGINKNQKLSKTGLEKKVGLGIGYGLNQLLKKKIIGYNLPTIAKIEIASACDVRMHGIDLPVSTSFGSGNQGILITLAIKRVAEDLNYDNDKVVYALAIAHIINGYVKKSLGKLSALCGCAIAAGLGVSAAISWMIDGDRRHIIGSMNNVLGNITGVICDGAKGSCALKLATSACESITSALLAKENIFIEKGEGIIEETIEKTIDNLCSISLSETKSLDNLMLEFITRR